MTITPLLRGPVSVAAYACTTEASARPYAEQHTRWSVSYVQAGSFGCQCRGARFELMPGAVLLGRPGDEFTCTHDHHGGGDECLAFFIEPEVADEIGGARHPPWQSSGLPPLPELMALSELARSVARRAAGPRVDEVGMALAAKVVDLVAGEQRPRATQRPVDRRRAIESARWIDLHSHQDIDLQSLATQTGLSVYHYLRVFSAVLGVTPHQYLLRCRLRKAAQLLSEEDRAITEIALDVGFADLSNFVRTFRRAAGVSPRLYRQASRTRRHDLLQAIARS
ncbi:MAG: helix-turn-helix transcriptional regulator [Proteobacteria bacterium]|nr:helix-turn-helix transcriptional regulator [Pseudomonadota bacterium]